MTEAELIKKIQELRQIKPRQDWVSLTKEQIFGQESLGEGVSWGSLLEFFPRLIFQSKPVFATVGAIFLFIAVFGFAQNSLPGDFFYSLKKLTERGQTFFVSPEERPKVQLELANKRLEELNKIAEANRVRNLAPAINEFQTNVSEAAKGLSKAKTADVKKIVQQTKKLEENKQKVETLGVVVGETEDLDNALSQITEREIKDLENRSLTEGQQKLLEEAKKDSEAGNYSPALEKILLLNYPQE